MTTIRFKTAAVATAILMAGSVGLAVAPAAQAAPAPGGFAAPTFKVKKTVKLAAKSDRYIPITINVTGTAADATSYEDTNGDGAEISYSVSNTEVKALKTNVKSYVFKPTIGQANYNSALRNGTNKSWRVQLKSYTTPGVYRVTFTVKQRHYDKATYKSTMTEKKGSFKITVKGTAKWAAAQSTTSRSIWVYRGATTTSFSAPEAYAGSKITAYFKAKGAKKFKKVGKTTKLKRSGGSARISQYKLRGIRVTGTIRYKITKAKYGHSPKYSVTVKYKKR